MDLKDWMGVSDQINQAGSAMRANEGLRLQADQNQIYRDRQQLDRQRTEREFSREDKEDAIKADEAKATEYFIRNMDKVAPEPAGNAGLETRPAGQPSLSQAVAPAAGGQNLAGAVQSAAGPAGGETKGAGVLPYAPTEDPLAGLNPEAVRRARINALDYQNKKLLSDDAVRSHLKQKAADLSDKYREGLAQAAMLHMRGQDDAALDVLIQARNQYRPNGEQAAKDPKTGELVLTYPTGEERRIKPRDVNAILMSEMAGFNNGAMERELVSSGIAASGYNRDQAKDKYEVLYRPDGTVGGYAVRLINKDLQTELKIFDRLPGMPGERELSPEEAGALVPAAAMQVNANVAGAFRQKEAMKYMEAWAKRNNSVATETVFGEAMKTNPQFATDYTLAADLISRINEQTGGTMDPARLFSQAAKMVEEAKAAAKNEYMKMGSVSSAKGQPDQEMADFVSRRASEAINNSLSQFSPEAWRAIAGGGSGAVQSKYEQYMGGGAVGATYDDPAAIDMSQYPPGRKYEIDDGTGRKVVAMNVGGRFVGIDGKPIF